MREPVRSKLQESLFAAAGGDEEAWRALVEAYSNRVFALLRAQCSDPDLAEEITQSTFCTVAAKLADYTELGRFEAWLFRIAMNRLRDEMRRRRRQAVAMEQEILSGLADAPAAAPDPGDDEHRIAILREAMRRLSDSDRQVIHLRHCAELSFRQIAEILDQPLGTVLARQHRALQKLHDLMTRIDAESSIPKPGTQ